MFSSRIFFIFLNTEQFQKFRSIRILVTELEVKITPPYTWYSATVVEQY